MTTALFCLAVLAGCGDAGTTGPASDPEISAVVLDPADAVFQALSQSEQFQFSARDGAGRVIGVDGASWRSLDTSVASVTQDGLVTAEGVGSTRIEVVVDGVPASADIVVEQLAADVEVVPAGALFDALGEETVFSARAVDSEGNALDPQPFLVWQSSDPNVASVGGGGRVIAEGPGSAQLLVYVGGMTRTVSVTVDQIPVELRLARSSATLWSVGARMQLGASAHDANGFALAGAPTIVWNSLAPEVATISDGGLLTAVAPGTGLVRAELGGTTQSVVVTVHQPAVSLQLDLGAPSIDALGFELQGVATAYDASGTLLSGTPPVAWSSSDPSVASVSEDGVVTAIAIGEATIAIEMDGLQAEVALTVQQVPAELRVTPGSAVLEQVGAEVQFTAVAFDANGRPLVTQPTVGWTSTAPAVATVSAAGTATAVSTGETVIRADAEGVPSGAAALRVEVAGAPPGGEPPPEPPGPPADVYTPTGIDATGATDVTDALMAFFNSVPDGSVVRFPEGAQYRIEGTLLLEDRTDLEIDGNGATLFATTTGAAVTPPAPLAPHWPRKRGQLYFHRGGGIKVHDLVIRGAHPNGGTNVGAYVVALEAQHGIELIGVDGAEVHDVRITDVYGDFVYFGGGTSNVHLHDSHLERNGRQGIAITRASGLLIEGNYIGQSRRALVDLEPNYATDVLSDIMIRDNTFGPGRLLFIAAGSSVGQLTDVTISGNTLVGKTMEIMIGSETAGPHSNIRILDNVSDVPFGSPHALMTLRRIEEGEVSGNTSPLQEGRGMVAVRTVQSCGMAVEGNVFPGAAVVYDPVDASSGCAPSGAAGR